MTWKGYVSFTYDDVDEYGQIISFHRRKPIEPFTLAMKEPQWNEAEEAEEHEVRLAHRVVQQLVQRVRRVLGRRVRREARRGPRVLVRD